MKSFKRFLLENTYDPSPTQAELNAIGVRSDATQIETTIALKIKPYLTDDELSSGLEYGAGLCHGAKILGVESFEPFPKEHVSPTYTTSEQLKKQYKFILNTYVLNVVAEDTRREIIKNIGKLLLPGGRAVIVTRGDDVASIKSFVKQYGEMEFIAKKGKYLTYQKGFTLSELINFCTDCLGAGFEIKKFAGSNKNSVKIQIIKADI